jgi:hypothetical protein
VSYTKAVDPLPPFALQWKPQLFSSAFSSIRLTHLHFTAFPPQHVPKHTFERISFDAASTLLHEDGRTAVLNLLATYQSKITPTCDIPLPANLPAELTAFLQGDDWDYYTISDSVPLPVGISRATTYKHHVAFRKLQNGVEHFIFGPGGLCIHSVCTIHDQGARYIEDIPRETLCLEEQTEVLCNKALKWWYESTLSKKTAQRHEDFRVRWDQRFRAEWRTLEGSQKADLLA